MLKISILFFTMIFFIKTCSFAFLCPDFMFESLDLKRNDSVCYIGTTDEAILNKALSFVPKEHVDIKDFKKSYYAVGVLTSPNVTKDIKLLSQALRKGGKGLLVAPLPDSDEFKFLTPMSHDPAWKDKLKCEVQLPLDKYNSLVIQNGFKDLCHYGIREIIFFDDPATFKDWILKEIVPFTSLQPSDYDKFADDYIRYVKQSEKNWSAKDQKFSLSLKHLVMLVRRDF